MIMEEEIVIYICKKCNVSNSNLNQILNHTLLNHSLEPNVSLMCCFPGCRHLFKSYKTFENHLVRYQHFNREPNNTAKTLKCDLQGCNESLTTIDQLYKHYYEHIKYKTLETQQMQCFYKGCFHKIVDLSSFVKHLSKQHGSHKNEINLKDSMFIVEEELSSFFYENDDQPRNAEPMIDQSELDLNYRLTQNFVELQQFYMRLYLKFKDKYLIAEYKCDEIFDDINNIIRVNNTHLVDLIKKTKIEYNNDATTINVIERHLDNGTLFEQVHSQCQFKSRKDEWLNISSFYVKPKKIQLNSTNTYQYIPIIDTLSSIFSNTEICNLYFDSNKSKNLKSNKIKSFNDALSFTKNELFMSEPESIQIVLYTDAFDSNNVVGDQRNKDKVNGTYFRIGNFENAYQSLNHFTQLAILNFVSQIKEHGYPKIFEPLLSDLKSLEINGIKIKYKNNELTLKATISFFPADNLASNGIGGFVTSFNSKIAYCRFCLAYGDSIQQLTKEDKTLLRTPETQENDLLSKSIVHTVHVNGVKSVCCLNELKYFDSVNGLPPDIMHDMLEGTVRVNIKLLMTYLSNMPKTDKHRYTPEQLNEDLASFPYGRIDKDNKPPTNLFTDKSSYKISATHQWIVMRILPSLIGEKLKNDSKFLHFVQLVEIVCLLHDDEFDELKINNLTMKIDKYLQEFKINYPGEKFTPKQHFLIHYPSAILQFGPPKFYSTMRFEAKHSYFKHIISATHNRVNLLKSLALRHQKLQVYHLSSNDFFVDIEYGSAMSASKHNLDFIQLNLKTSKNISLYKWVSKKGIKYHVNDIVVSRKTALPIFSKIKTIVSNIKNEIYFQIEELQTVEYIHYMAAYKLKEIESIEKIISIKDLYNIWPLDAYHLNSQFQLVIPKYPL